MNKSISNKVYIYVLLIFNIINLLFIPFNIAFKLAENEYYHYVVFAFTLLATLSSLLIVISELISLRIDRTATKNTFFAALFIFISLLTSKDFIYSLSLFIPNVLVDLKILTSYVFQIVFVLSYSLALYYLLKFFERDYGVKRYSFKIAIMYILFSLLNILFIVLGIKWMVALLFTIQGVTSIVCFSYYLSMSSRTNYITAILAYFISISLSLNFLLNAYSHISGTRVFYYLFISLAFIFIYLNFFLNKTNLVYQYFDNNTNREVDNIMVVKCFQCFDCFIGDKLVVFPSKKSKEFFALLVILNGKSLSMEKAITYLYPDKDVEKAKISYRDIIWKLRKLFESLSFNGVIFRRGETTLLVNHIKCDYIDVIKHNEVYDGSPLMPEYEWSFEFENTLEE